VVITGVGALTVEGKPVLPFRPVPGALVGPCTAPSPPGTPCVGVATLVAGAATRLRVNGAPVLLAATFAATTSGAPLPAFDIEVAQNKLRAE
jgi:hypothetical protein